MTRIQRTAAMIAMVLLPCTTLAQDHNYWNNQFGSRSALMGGAVVGGVRDTSAVFYNPGALGFIDNQSLSVSANALRVERSVIENGAGDGRDLDSDTLSVVPLLISGITFLNDSGSDVLGYGILTRNSYQLEISERRDVVGNILNSGTFPGEENYIGQISADTKLDEYWGGVGYSHRFNEQISAGLTTFVAVRSQSFNEQTFARVISTDTFAASTSNLSSNYDFYNVRLLWKGGVSVDCNPVKIGLTVTTPSIDLFGDGTSAGDLTVTNVDIDGDGLPDTFVADDRQDDLDAEIRSPLSIAAGLDWQITDQTVIAVTGEWFTALGAYDVMTPEARDFIRPPGVATGLFNSQDFLTVLDAADDVFNVALAVEHSFTETLKGILSFRTDYSNGASIAEQGKDRGITDWNVYHVTVGGTYRRERSELALGLVYSFADKDDAQQVVNFDNPSEDTFLFGRPGSASANYDALSIILGYTYYFS